MSLPKFPDLPKEYGFENSVFQIMAAIAMEEIGLSHILNAEGEKIQYVLGTLPDEDAPNPTIEQVLEINQSVQDTLRQVTYSQIILGVKMSDALKTYIQSKKLSFEDDIEEPSEPSEPEVPTFALKNGPGPYEPRIVTGDWTQTFTLRANVTIISGEEPDIEIVEDGAIKLKDILTGSDYSGINVTAFNSGLSAYFRIGEDKAGDPAIIYTYIPNIEVWAGWAPELPVVNETLILSKQGFDDLEINTVLRYDGSLFVQE